MSLRALEGVRQITYDETCYLVGQLRDRDDTIERLRLELDQHRRQTTGSVEGSVAVRGTGPARGRGHAGGRAPTHPSSGRTRDRSPDDPSSSSHARPATRPRHSDSDTTGSQTF